MTIRNFQKQFKSVPSNRIYKDAHVIHFLSYNLDLKTQNFGSLFLSKQLTSKGVICWLKQTNLTFVNNQLNTQFFFISILYMFRTVIKVLCYKSEGRWFDPI